MKDFYDYELPKFTKVLQQLLYLNQEIIRKLDEIKFEQTAQPVSQLDGIVFIDDVSKRLGLSNSTLYKYVSAGKIPYSKIGNRHLFYESDIKELINRNYQPVKGFAPQNDKNNN